MQEQDVDVLNQRLAEARQSEVAGGGGMAAAEAPEPDAAAGEEGQPSFLKSTDEEVASALADRIAAMAAVQGSGGGDGGALTGPLLKELLLSKWGKAYDLSFVRRDPPLGKTLICLNVSARVAPRVRWASHMCSKGCACGAHRNSCALWIAPFLPLLHNRPTSHLPQVMWTHLEQRSFPMTEEEYDEKLDLMALYLNSWGQAERVESFLRQPARPQRGLPSKPIVGVAVSIQVGLHAVPLALWHPKAALSQALACSYHIHPPLHAAAGLGGRDCPRVLCPGRRVRQGRHAAAHGCAAEHLAARSLCTYDVPYLMQGRLNLTVPAQAPAEPAATSVHWSACSALQCSRFAEPDGRHANTHLPFGNLSNHSLPFVMEGQPCR
jgi:hypothetical protein